MRTPKQKNLQWLLAVVIAAGCGLLATTHSASAQTWTLTSAPMTNWCSIVSSADGMVLVAATSRQGSASGEAVFVSTNSGNDWFQTDLPATNAYYAVASSVDGTRLTAIAIASMGTTWVICCSTNAGETWTLTTSNYYNVSVGSGPHCFACSADGTRLATIREAIYTSADGGASWTSHNVGGPNDTALASSADGNRLAIITKSSAVIFLSTNAGTTWVTNSLPGLAFEDIASSADGTHLVAAAGNSFTPDVIYTSSDSGMTWISNNVPKAAWVTVASSADGTWLAAYAAYGPFVTSTNAGATWQAGDAPWSVPNTVSLVASADGARLVAAVRNISIRGPTPAGGIFIRQTIRPPRLNLTPNAGGPTLSWLVPSTNFALQQSCQLGSAAWLTLTNAPTLDLTTLRYQVLASPSSSAGFYRLATP